MKSKGCLTISFLVLIVVVLSSGMADASAQELIWQNNWTASQYLTLGNTAYNTSSTNVAFSPDGEILLGAPSATQWDDQFERLEGNGTVLWSENIGGGLGSSPGTTMSLLANADGSAEVLASSGFQIAKINPDGSIAWARSASYASALIGISAQALAVTDCSSVSLINANTGQTTWQYAISQPTSNCPSPSAIADSSGNVYAVYTSYDPISQSFNGYRCLKLGATGKKVWDVLASDSPASYLRPIQPFGANSTLVYINTLDTTMVVALNATNGSAAWTASGYGLGVVTASGEPIVLNASEIQSLNITTGKPHWSQTAPVAADDIFDVATVTGNDILFESYDGNPSMLARLNASTGAIVWSVALPQSDSFGDTLEPVAVGEITGPTVVAVLKPFSQSAPPVLEEVNFATGQLLGQIPFATSSQGVNSTSVLAGSSGIAAAAVTLAPTSGQLRVRMLNAATGATLWETVDSSTPVAVSPAATGVAVGGSTGCRHSQQFILVKSEFSRLRSCRCIRHVDWSTALERNAVQPQPRIHLLVRSHGGSLGECIRDL